MPVTTASAAVHIAPVVVKTFFKHNKTKVEKRLLNDRKEVPQDDIFFDQAFNIVKAFITLGTKNTVESLQAFTNTHVPAPPWAAVSPVTIPLSTCNEAADHLVEWFGPEELKYVVGGERWWQVRGLDGVEGEWIAELEDLQPYDGSKVNKGKKLSDEDANILRMERLETVMLYVHGGGYFWGSINTHRYQILHYAHKFKGRAFAVNYRKAPQYPWPCPLQDVLAAYLYLIRPPASAIHRAISPSKIVFAGDSAGGGLCLTTLTILRDLGLPLPAGAVLISPWVDLTHSFPSVMQNYETDIIPKHGFLAKPSTLWPNPTVPGEGGRVISTVSNDPPKPGKADTLKPSKDRIEVAEDEEYSRLIGCPQPVRNQEAMLERPEMKVADSEKGSCSNMPSSSFTGNTIGASVESALPPMDLENSYASETTRHDASLFQSGNEDVDANTWEPKPPKVLMQDPNALPLELRSQIQMYASSELLTHPLVSPVLQSSLGNLPPLYILAGDGEVLRDEIVYLAHKAAHPSKYHSRPGVLRDGRRQKENSEKFTKPTKVHLQVFDGMCHVLTVFMFAKNAKYAYRSIAEFTKHVTKYDAEHIERNPFPEFHQPPDNILNEGGVFHTKVKEAEEKTHLEADDARQPLSMNGATNAKEDISPDSDFEGHLQNERISKSKLHSENTNVVADNPSAPENKATSSPSDTGVKDKNDVPGTFMVRERVDIHGKVRPMEPAGEVAALQLKPSEIGIIKEAPTLRWLNGQKVWDARYKKNTERILKQKAKWEAKAEQLIKNAMEQGLVHVDTDFPQSPSEAQTVSEPKIQLDRRWGPLDLEGEKPAATAIAGRRDTPEAVALLKKSIYHTAPRTHRTVPKLKASQAIAAAFDPNDDPLRPPRQSVSEQQSKAVVIPMHGLSMWDGIVRYFGRKTTAKAADSVNTAATKVGLKGAPESD